MASSKYSFINSSNRRNLTFPFFFFFFFYCHLEIVCQVVADVAFLVDSSSSIGLQNWARMMQFLKNIVKVFNVGPDKTHIAFVSFSTSVVLEFKFDRLKGSQITEAGYYSLIDKIRYQGGATNIDEALILAEQQVFIRRAGMRPELPQVRPKQHQLLSYVS